MIAEDIIARVLLADRVGDIRAQYEAEYTAGQITRALTRAGISMEPSLPPVEDDGECENSPTGEHANGWPIRPGVTRCGYCDAETITTQTDVPAAAADQTDGRDATHHGDTT